MQTILSLNGSWNLCFGPEPLTDQARERLTLPADSTDFKTISAQVPGNVELDLQAADLLPDLVKANNIYKLLDYETFQWFYQKTFVTPKFTPGQRVLLRLAGVDTFATIILNGQKIGSCQNMFIEHELDITDFLKPSGENELLIRIDSPILASRKHQPNIFEYGFTTNFESICVRKAPHMYGWDIMPRIVSAGLWRDVSLVIQNPARFRSHYLTTLWVNPQEQSAQLLLDYDLTTDQRSLENFKVRFTLRHQDKIAHQEEFHVFSTHARKFLTLQNLHFWYPRGYGSQPLYEATLELLDDVTLCDQLVWNLGIRTVELRRSDITTAEKPGEFLFLVNHTPIYIKGTNWVPLDGLHSRDMQHLDAAIAMIVDLNCNMIRCWGGNVYEDHAFFDLCDRHGILIWQDFALACAIYPQSDAFAEEIRKEAESVVIKLRNHPSLALWAGNNEIDDAFFWCGTKIDPNHDRLSRKVIPDVIRRFDPLREFLPSSPYRSPAMIAAGNDALLKPEEHLWGPRDDFKGSFYTQSLAHFVSEIGYHGCPNRETMEAMMDPDHLWPWENNEQWITHATRPHPKATEYNYRIPLMAKQIKILFGEVPDNLDDFILASQISQAEAKKFFIEMFRMRKFRRTGMLWWNLRDGWPVISDAVVDYYNRKKLAYQYIKNSQYDIAVMCGEPANGQHPIIAANDTLHPASGTLHIEDLDSGRVLLEKNYHVPANDKAAISIIPASEKPAMYLLRYDVNGRIQHNHYLAGPRPFSVKQYRQWLEKFPKN